MFPGFDEMWLVADGDEIYRIYGRLLQRQSHEGSGRVPLSKNDGTPQQRDGSTTLDSQWLTALRRQFSFLAEAKRVSLFLATKHQAKGPREVTFPHPPIALPFQNGFLITAEFGQRKFR